MAESGTMNVQRRREMREGYLFIAPAFIHLLIFVILPIFAAIYLSFHNWNILNPSRPFVGLENYKRLWSDELFWMSLKTTLYYTVVSVPIGIVLSLALAMAMKAPLKGIGIFRTAYFLPVITSMIVVSLVWTWMFDPLSGLLNYYLKMLGLRPQAWLADPFMAMPSIIILSVWKSLGYNMVIFLAGLQAIPDMYYEAARIDGANAWQQFRRITLPLLRPTTFFILITTLISSFQVFDQVYVMTGGGPANLTKVLVYYIFEVAFHYFEMGYASALSFILFLFTLVLTALQFKLMSKDSYTL
ncbi:MAG TPA: sugar ABC transporter permease [Bacillota bacterium]